ncbi:MAG: hypothetical protein IAE82_16095 [Opitutaceae bacterium]|nr:hypothetical protein [Opitutaceae bacterium]
MKSIVSILAIACAQIGFAAAPGTRPIQLHPDNPQRFLFRGKPTVLLTVGEHYASLLNRDFDFRAYHAALAAAGLNQTRVFSGAQRGAPGPDGAGPLGPVGPHNFVGPWAWSNQPGGVDGLKFDLDHWNHDYFTRLADLLRSASEHGIIVEFVFFCAAYDENGWPGGPLNADNSIQGDIRLSSAFDQLTLRNPTLVARQKAYVTRVVEACRDFDNVYFEVANEPYWNNKGNPPVTPEERAAWHNEMIRAITDAERDLPAESRHMIAVNEWHEQFDAAHISVLNLHYVNETSPFGAMRGLNDYTSFGKALVFDETEFARSNRVRRYSPADARAEAWEFMLGGGSGYSNLALGQYSPSDESGSGPVTIELRRQIGALKRFLDTLDLVAMRCDTTVLAEPPPAGSFARAISAPGRFYALHLHQSDPGGLDQRRAPSYQVRTGDYHTNLTLDLPVGTYALSWIEPVTASVRSTDQIVHAGGRLTLETPPYTEDIALTLHRIDDPPPSPTPTSAPTSGMTDRPADLGRSSPGPTNATVRATSPSTMPPASSDHPI